MWTVLGTFGAMSHCVIKILIFKLQLHFNTVTYAMTESCSTITCNVTIWNITNLLCFRIIQWDLLCNKEYVSSLITSIQMVGLFFGATMFGQLGDTFGRKRMLYLNYTLFLLFHFLSAFANSWQLYSVCRFFVGVFYAGKSLTPHGEILCMVSRNHNVMYCQLSLTFSFAYFFRNHPTEFHPSNGVCW